MLEAGDWLILPVTLPLPSGRPAAETPACCCVKSAGAEMSPPMFSQDASKAPKSAAPSVPAKIAAAQENAFAVLKKPFLAKKKSPFLLYKYRHLTPKTARFSAKKRPLFLRVWFNYTTESAKSLGICAGGWQDTAIFCKTIKAARRCRELFARQKGGRTTQRWQDHTCGPPCHCRA